MARRSGPRRAVRGVTAQLEVDAGWERGVESVLGDTLEAVHVDSIDAVAARIGRSWPAVT